MKISEIYVYPVKSLMGVKLDRAQATTKGFKYDRIFMLQKVEEDPDGSNTRRLRNMHITHFPLTTRFLTAIAYPNENTGDLGHVMVQFNDPGSHGSSSIEIPLQPDTTGFETIEVSMHKTQTVAYDMGEPYNKWFSDCFGFDVMLAYLGGHSRSVLMSTDTSEGATGTWLSSLSSYVPGLNPMKNEEKRITFADCAPYLVISSTSLRDVSARLPAGEEMDISKFRPNLIVEGADAEWEEDYWAGIDVGEVKLVLPHNCARCQSINIDYASGDFGKGEAGSVLKKLQRDRRVDKGSKYSPIFGRYGFLDIRSDGKAIAVGDEVTVVKTNGGHTVFGK